MSIENPDPGLMIMAGLILTPFAVLLVVVVFGTLHLGLYWCFCWARWKYRLWFKGIDTKKEPYA